VAILCPFFGAVGFDYFNDCVDWGEAPAERSLELPYFEDLALFRVIPLHGSVPGSVASRSLWGLNTTIWGQILKKNVRHSGKAQV